MKAWDANTIWLLDESDMKTKYLALKLQLSC
jgi:hypothetical protein